MCEDGGRSEQGVRFVYVGIGGVGGEEGLHEGYFGGVFRDVRLDWVVGCLGEVA